MVKDWAGKPLAAASQIADATQNLHRPFRQGFFMRVLRVFSRLEIDGMGQDSKVPQEPTARRSSDESRFRPD